MAAKTFNKPVYVAVESFKFSNLYPLNQRDIPNIHTVSQFQHVCSKSFYCSSPTESESALNYFKVPAVYAISRVSAVTIDDGICVKLSLCSIKLGFAWR